MNTNPIPGSDTNIDLATLLTTPLERGKACVECRRKKQAWKHVLLAIADGSIITETDSVFDCDRDLPPSKCDGLRPSCWSCIRTNRACSYERQPTRPVSIILQERLGELETKLQNLIRGQEAASSPPIIGMSQQGVGARAATGIGGTGGDFKQTPNADIPTEIMSGLKWWENKTVPAAVHNYLFVSKSIYLRVPSSTSDSRFHVHC
ncbi:hypothetical protein M407DRAFT_24921 [Tulasnella calospora MUT 4182]|uniref:Zn(2)-C6 fungal-type domain-containing protein n=1 Tax=Tulasnella calospora MUT 4182 TaxID=1051891 RepID=A0A0C3QIH0_9AGAM|nr:hypothetical protein M407DRAFT_24921 [Tulasnella calospora MUT 4182]